MSPTNLSQPRSVSSTAVCTSDLSTNGGTAEWPQREALGQIEHTLCAGLTFLSGILAISAAQMIGAPFKLLEPTLYDGYMAWTKESFAVLCTLMTQWWSPTAIRVTGDESMSGQLFQMDDGSLRCNFPHRLVLMSNHQLYTDWLYLWWIAYTNKMHGRIHIILKESLKQIPIFGWGAQFYNFIFLSRKWQTDRPRFSRALRRLGSAIDPMWLVIFPEGTNLSKPTRESSKAWADKQRIPDLKHLLLPRSTGMQLCLQELAATTNWLYDCTIAYEGVPSGCYGQDVFTLRSCLLEGRPPVSVNMHWRRFRISDIPIKDAEAFSMWLRNRWTEKDYLLAYFYRYGAFPTGAPMAAFRKAMSLEKLNKAQTRIGKASNVKIVPQTAGFITTEVKVRGKEEFSEIFTPLVSAMKAILAGQTRPDNIEFDLLLSRMVQQCKESSSSPLMAIKHSRLDHAAQNNMAAVGRRYLWLKPNEVPEAQTHDLSKDTHDATQHRSHMTSVPMTVRKPFRTCRSGQIPKQANITTSAPAVAVRRAGDGPKKIVQPPKLSRKTHDTASKVATTIRVNKAAPSGLQVMRATDSKIEQSETASRSSGLSMKSHPLAGRIITPEQLKQLKAFKPNNGGKN